MFFFFNLTTQSLTDAVLVHYDSNDLNRKEIEKATKNWIWHSKRRLMREREIRNIEEKEVEAIKETDDCDSDGDEDPENQSSSDHESGSFVSDLDVDTIDL